jgi:hypothetical protein
MAIRRRLLSGNTLDSDTELAYMPERLHKTDDRHKTEHLHMPGRIRRNYSAPEHLFPFPIGRWTQPYMAGTMSEIPACSRFDVFVA